MCTQLYSVTMTTIVKTVDGKYSLPLHSGSKVFKTIIAGYHSFSFRRESCSLGASVCLRISNPLLKHCMLRPSNSQNNRSMLVSIPQILQWFLPLGEVDLFVMRENAKDGRFCSWAVESIISLGDAFQIHWQRVLFNAFKARRERSNMILVVPFWLCQIWFLILMEIFQVQCLPLPKQSDLTSINQLFYHNLHFLNMMAYRFGIETPYSPKKYS